MIQPPERQTNTNQQTNNGIGFVGLLTILFIGLKLTGYITWSWWWVLSPLWISFLLGVLVVGITAIVLWKADKL